MSRILVCSPRVPHHDRESGSRRLWHAIGMLRGAGHEVAVLVEGWRGEEGARLELTRAGVAVWSGLDGRAVDLVRHGGFDLALVAFWHMAETVVPLIREVSPRTRIVVDSVDLHFVRQSRGLLRAGGADGPRGWLDERFGEETYREINAYRAADAVLAVSRQEADLVDLLLGAPGVAAVVPDGEDLAASPVPVDRRHGIVFLGNFQHPPNGEALEWLAAEIAPRIDRELLAEHPLLVVGNRLGPAHLPTVHAIPGAVPVGWVPDPIPYLERARVSVAPLLSGAGTKRKLLQALMVGTPTVTTSIGAEGLPVEDSRDLLVRDDPAGFARAVELLLTDDGVWTSLAREGRRAILPAHGLERMRERLLAVVDAQLALLPADDAPLQELPLVEREFHPPGRDAGTTAGTAVQPDPASGAAASGRRASGRGRVGGPWIAADPNPVPGGPGRGRTVVSWDTGGRPGEVTVAKDDGPATPFAAGVRDHAPVDWIEDGARYRFELRATHDRRRLGEVTVARAPFDWDAAWDAGSPDGGPPARRETEAGESDARAVERALAAIVTALGRGVDPGARTVVEAARAAFADGPSRAQVAFLAALAEDLRPALVIEAGTGRATPALLGPGGDGPHVVSFSPDGEAIRRARRIVRRRISAAEPRVAFIERPRQRRSGRRAAEPAFGVDLATALGGAAVDLAVVNGPLGRDAEGLAALREIAPIARAGTVVVFAGFEGRPGRAALASWERRFGGAVLLRRLPVGKRGVVVAVLRTGGGRGVGTPSGRTRVASGGEVRLFRVASVASAPLRAPRLPEADRAPTYLDHFDATTLFYDVFRSADGRQAIALGPPLPSAAGDGPDLEFRSEQGGPPLAYRQVPEPAAPGSQLPARIEIAAPIGTERLSVRFGGRSWLAAVQPSLAVRFAGSVALATVSRDNDLEWIADWARFHAVTCGVDAVVLYDNGSTRYGIPEIEEALAAVPGIREALVIAQPVRFGPRRRDIAGDPHGFPDMFLQSAMLRHALDRILPRARAMLNLDVDELLVLREGEEFLRWISRPEPAIEVPRFEVRQPGAWDGSRPARHRDAWFQPMPRVGIPAKWVLRPEDLPDTARLGIHAVTDVPVHACLPDEAFVAHVREITHRVGEPARVGVLDAGARLRPNPWLRQQLERAFGAGDDPGRLAWSRARRGVSG